MKKELVEVPGTTLPFYRYEEGDLILYEFDATECDPPEPMVNTIKGLALLQNDKDRLVGTFFHEPFPLYERIPMIFSHEAKELEKIPDLSDTKILAQKLGVGEVTLQDIIKELAKPGFDPREELPSIPFKDDMTDIKMLREGSIVSGVVRNIADFGAFVDIGLKNDGMIHISQMSDKRISHPLEILSVNQYLARVEVIAVDAEKGKVSLSLKGVS